MKLEKLLNKEGKFTELIRITDFTSVDDCLEIFINHFQDPYWTKNNNEKDYKYAYLSGDCEVYFVENLNEFYYSECEEDWKVNSSIEMN
jgi:hypothetical protein